MTIRLATQCAQIEMVVNDVQRACQWFSQKLGAMPIEQDLVKRITGKVLDIDHRDCGDGMFQFCSVITDDMPHVWFIDTLGPCVTNLNFFMDDADEAFEILAATGAATKLHLPIAAGLRAVLGPDLARPEDEIKWLYFMGTWPLFGFDLEFTTRPWRDGVEQQVFYPSFTYPRPTTNETVDRLAALRVVVDDVDRTIGNLLTLIDRDSRSEPYGETTSPTERVVNIRLRDLELRYTQPLSPKAWYHDRVASGGGTVAAVFRTDDPDAIIDAVTDAALERRDDRVRIASRDILGFDVELETPSCS
jgi:hypothetical protein